MQITPRRFSSTALSHWRWGSPGHERKGPSCTCRSRQVVDAVELDLALVAPRRVLVTDEAVRFFVRELGAA